MQDYNIGGNGSLSDAELVAMAQAGDMAAEEALLRKYKKVVKMKSNMYFMAGADEDDVVQEGMIGLFKAIRQYDPDREASFATFASICITRQIISAIRAAGRAKHKALNTYVSLNRPVKGSNEEMMLADTLGDNMVENPEALMVMKDVAYYILHNDGNIFSELEMQVLNELIKGSDYAEISKKLNRTPKSVDNTMRRVRRKVVEYLLK